MKAPPALGDGWQVGDLAGADLDRNAISELVEMIDAGVTTPNIHAVLIEHMGRLVFEQYWTGEDGELGTVEHGPETLHDIRSISKSVTSLLLGIVLEGDAGEALARPITSFFPNRNGLNADLGAVTLHQVLTMTAGLAWNESIVPYTARNDYIRLISSRDPVGFVLGKELRDSPGEIWNYNSGLTDLVAAVIESISGQPLMAYADEVLFGPLGISEYEWWRPPAWPMDSFPSASAGLRMRARDLAKIASITMNGGKWQDRQIVPETWIERSTARHVDNTWGQFGYGYFWYRGRLVRGNQAIRASGYGDQEVFVLPDDGLAITIFAGNYDDPNWAVGERIAGRVVRARE
ncbi:MAG: serine hydrolase [Pseudomonadota bacterium]